MQKVQTDYQPVSKLILAYPERFYNWYDELVPFYDKLIELIPEDIQIWAITNNDQTSDKLQEQFSHKQLNTYGIKGWDEIWVRDCLGIIQGDAILKPEYSPNYCNKNLTNYYKQINKSSRRIIKDCLEKDIIEIPLKFECGNFVCNDKFVYLTDKVLQQNQNISPEHITQIINVMTGLTPIFIKGNINDTIGHTDGYINFIDDNKVLIASYPSFPFLQDDIDFLNRIDEELVSVGVERITLYDRPVNEGAINCGCNGNKPSNCILSARGNYINFLQINRTIILPEYTLPTKRETNFYNKVNQEILERLGFEVKRINCDLLSKFGGVLHCISFTA